MIGTTLSHYRIFDKLGQGGMGVIRRGEGAGSERFVAAPR